MAEKIKTAEQEAQAAKSELAYAREMAETEIRGLEEKKIRLS